MSVLRVGLAGLGTVGAGVLGLLRENAEEIARRAGRPIEVVAVSARDRTRDRGVSLDGLRWHEDAEALAHDPEVDVVAELIGGAEGPARRLVEASLRAGRPVVTANKALLAKSGRELSRLAAETGAALLFEASVAGGIPAVKLVREGLAGDRLLRVGGILNGTSNYILTEMRESGREFSDVLAQAQALGYAEADPTADIGGWDAAHKLAILTGLAFGRGIDIADLPVEGIERVSAVDHAMARELGHRIRLLGMAERTGDGVAAWVRPCLVPATSPLGQVDGVFNAVVADGAHVGRLMIEGRGAGAGPTSVAVVADLIDFARGARPAPTRETSPVFPCLPEGEGGYYLRLRVRDRPGVIAAIATILGAFEISLRSLLQHEDAAAGSDQAAVIVLLTHPTASSRMEEARKKVAALESVMETPVLLRLEAG